MSGDRVTFVGDAMAAVVQGVIEVENLIGRPPVIVGGLAVLSRLSTPHRATVDLDVVDRPLGDVRQLELLRRADGAQPAEPAAVTLPTQYGPVRVDVLEVRQVEIDVPSNDPGDRLHAAAHAWADDTATNLTIEVIRVDGSRVEATSPVAEPGPLVAMKLQAVENRSAGKQGTDMLDIVRLTLDGRTRPVVLEQTATVDASVALDIAQHVDRWFVRRRIESLRRIQAVGVDDMQIDDLALVSELLLSACERS